MSQVEKQIVVGMNTVDGVLPIDPVIQQKKEETEKKKQEMSELVTQTLDTHLNSDEHTPDNLEIYEDILAKRETTAITLENIVLKAFKKYNILETNKRTANVYFGVQNSLIQEIDIVAVGVTAEEAINAYFKYAEENNLSGAFKIYPISNALYQAMICRSNRKISKQQFPKAKLLTDGDTIYDYRCTPGMVDLVIRENPYPTANSICEIADNVMWKLVNSLSTDTTKYTPEIAFVNLYYGNTTIGHTKYEFIEDKIKYNILDRDKNKINVQDMDTILFETFYGNCSNDVINNTTSFSNTSFNAITDIWISGGIFSMEFEFYIKNDVHTLNENMTIQCIFTHQDAPPKISTKLGFIEISK